MHVKKLTAEIRNKEVQLFVKNFQTMGTTSTFLCGLGFGCLYMKPDYLHKVNQNFGWRDDTDPFQLIHSLFAVSAIGCSMMVMATSAYCIIFGMDLAVRGEEGSVSVAAERLYEERKFVLRVFWLAVILILFSGASLAYVKFHLEARWTIITLLLAFGIFIAWYVKFRVRERFRFPSDEHGNRVGKKPGAFLLSDGYNPEHGVATKIAAGAR